MDHRFGTSALLMDNARTTKPPPCGLPIRAEFSMPVNAPLGAPSAPSDGWLGFGSVGTLDGGNNVPILTDSTE